MWVNWHVHTLTGTNMAQGSVTAVTTEVEASEVSSTVEGGANDMGWFVRVCNLGVPFHPPVRYAKVEECFAVRCR